MTTSKQRVENWSRRMNERLEIAHERFEKYLTCANGLGPDHSWSSHWKANRVICYSGLTYKEVDDLYKCQ